MEERAGFRVGNAMHPAKPHPHQSLSTLSSVVTYTDGISVPYTKSARSLANAPLVPLAS